VFENFMNAFAHVFDPHSSYFSPRNSEEYRIQMSLSYEGIGASLQSIDDYVTIMEILPGGSAQQNGELKAQDRILAVGQGKDGKMVDVVGWRLDDVVQLIRGPMAPSCACRSSRATRLPARRSACSRCHARRSRSRRRRRRKKSAR
jgi:carboxyl-terminal processing protease